MGVLKVFSFGGGVQSMAALVLAAQGRLDYSTFVFCNVGEDSENPATLDYVRQVALPYAQAHGLALHEVQRQRRDGRVETLYGRLTRPGSSSVGIPVRLSNGAPGARACTVDFKIAVCDRWLRDHGVQAQLDYENSLIYPGFLTRPLAVVGLGISLDEWQRMRNDSGAEWKQLAYPLIDLRLDRAACMQIIRQAGLSVPPKSSCWFCPYHSLQVWQHMRHEQPELFAKAVALEKVLNAKRHAVGKDQVWLTGKLKPLDQVTTDYVQGSLFDGEEESPCESGYCFV